MFKLFTAVVIMLAFHMTSFAQEPIFPSSREIVRIELWTEGITKDPVVVEDGMPEELSIALDGVEY